MPPVIETAGLHKSFGAVVAAADITVSVGKREVVGMIGANGAGKTTFINMVTGYLKPDRGRIRYMGDDITARPPRDITRLGISRSFQIPQLFAGLSVRDNLLVALGLAGSARPDSWRPLKRDETVAAAARILDRYGISAYGTQQAGLLPQGVRKLLDIAMAMIGEPNLVLLDEPTSGISVDEKFAVMDTLMAILGEQGVTVLFVEHDMEIVERYGERVIAFYDGRVIADGPPRDVLAAADVRQYVVGSELHRQGAVSGGAGC